MKYSKLAISSAEDLRFGISPFPVTTRRGLVIGVEIVKEMNQQCEDFFQKHGLKSEIRLTPNDLRDLDRPPKPRSSKYLEPMMELFEKGALAGTDLFRCGKHSLLRR